MEENMNPEQQQLLRYFVIDPYKKDPPENLDKPKKLLTSYEKKQIEFDQTAQSLEVLIESMKILKDNNLLDEVDEIKMKSVYVEKLTQLINRL